MRTGVPSIRAEYASIVLSVDAEVTGISAQVTTPESASNEKEPSTRFSIDVIPDEKS